MKIRSLVRDSTQNRRLVGSASGATLYPLCDGSPYRSWCGACGILPCVVGDLHDTLFTSGLQVNRTQCSADGICYSRLHAHVVYDRANRVLMSCLWFDIIKVPVLPVIKVGNRRRCDVDGSISTRRLSGVMVVGVSGRSEVNSCVVKRRDRRPPGQN